MASLSANVRGWPINLTIGLGILLLHIAIAVTALYWAPYGYADVGVGVPFSSSSFAHLFGVDQLGRDVFSRVVLGAATELKLTILGTSIGFFVGCLIGLASGLMGGWVDTIIQRIIETLISIPILVFALLCISAASTDWAGSDTLVILVVAFIYMPRIARIARSAAIEVAQKDFVAVSMLRGETIYSIILRDILPNSAGVMLVEFALRASYAPILIGSLGFLGFGVRPPTPEWGVIISENRQLLMLSPVTVLGPGFFLASLVIGLNLFTDGLSHLVSHGPKEVV
jgi:peptide/nickel transport system permease protein